MLDLTFTTDRIRQLRERLGMTQRVFAEQAGVSQATVAKWELGSRVPAGADVLHKLLLLESQEEAAV